MMELSVEIESNDFEEIIDALYHIIELLRDGFTSGYEPSWSLTTTPEVDWEFIDDLN